MRGGDSVVLSWQLQGGSEGQHREAGAVGCLWPAVVCVGCGTNANSQPRLGTKQRLASEVYVDLQRCGASEALQHDGQVQCAALGRGSKGVGDALERR